MLTEEGKFDPEKDSPFGLAKTRIRHSKAGTKSKKAAAEEPAAEGAEGEGEVAVEGEGEGAKEAASDS